MDTNVPLHEGLARLTLSERTTRGTKLTATNVSSPSERDIVLVDSMTALRDMLKALQGSSELAVDCEGLSLDRHGKLCLLALSPRANCVFVVDVSVLGQRAFTTTSETEVETVDMVGDHGDNGACQVPKGGVTVKALLEDAAVQKLLYDVRRDSDALYHQYGVQLQNVLDLQVAGRINKCQRPTHPRVA